MKYTEKNKEDEEKEETIEFCAFLSSSLSLVLSIPLIHDSSLHAGAAVFGFDCKQKTKRCCQRSPLFSLFSSFCSSSSVALPLFALYTHTHTPRQHCLHIVSRVKSVSGKRARARTRSLCFRSPCIFPSFPLLYITSCFARAGIVCISSPFSAKA
jgi:hypothetical protein